MRVYILSMWDDAEMQVVVAAYTDKAKVSLHMRIVPNLECQVIELDAPVPDHEWVTCHTLTITDHWNNPEYKAELVPAIPGSPRRGQVSRTYWSLESMEDAMSLLEAHRARIDKQNKTRRRYERGEL